MATWRTDVNPHTVKMLQCVGYFYVIGQEGEILAPGWLDHAPVNRWRMERNARLILVLSHLPTTCPRAILLTNDSQSVTKNNFIFFFFLWPAMNELRLSPYGAQKASSSPHHIFFSLGNTEWTFGPHQRLCTLSNVMKWIEVF